MSEHQTYYSQIGQDKYYIENVAKGKRNGYFVDVGAHNGIDFSNTYKLEKDYDWNGLCIEVDDDMFTQLKNNRKCSLAHECVFSKTGEFITLEVPLANPLPEGNTMITRIKDNPLYQTGFSFQEQFKETRTYTKVSKTLTEIFKEHNVPPYIDYMSIDIEGADYDALLGLDFSKYTIGFLTIEWGGIHTDYLEKIKTFMEKNNYKVHRFNKWDVEFVPAVEKRAVNSFDFWDTLVARDMYNFTGIFQAMVDDYGFPPDFKQQRINAEYSSNGTLDDTYVKLAQHYKWNEDQRNAARKKELLTEMRYIIPITENLCKVADGDIIVSDNYFNAADLLEILRFVGFTKNVEIVVTPDGKRSRRIWNQLLEKYDIKCHHGDNEETDIKSAQEFSIKTELTKVSNFTTAELYYITHNHKAFKQMGYVLRNHRLNNPYYLSKHTHATKGREIWNDLFNHVFPVMVQYCVFIESIATKHRLTKIRFLTRDNTLTQSIFQTLFPRLDVSQFISSQYLNKSGSPAYKRYIEENCDDGTLLVDLNGSFKSGRALYKSVLGHYPHVCLFTYDEMDAPFDTLHYMYKRTDGVGYSFTYEKFTQPHVGRYIGIRNNGTFIHFQNEYEHPDVVQHAIQSFASSISPIKGEPPSIDLGWLKTFINTTPIKCIDLAHNSHPMPFFETNDIVFA